ncbi:hypothetical protein HJ588_09410 [Flexivirga sp. ID2601S]|uniref:DUF4440 domain-containing protein n=1 Tax=Flexivirga aerilata TaxID=1656889 RepID=A0A849AJQ7_9MICO|nr:hypothetical protein [Flexivirga aerilata]NNG39488.1 hypothetical protein [Flexivirga aerilata]
MRFRGLTNTMPGVAAAAICAAAALTVSGCSGSTGIGAATSTGTSRPATSAAPAAVSMAEAKAIVATYDRDNQRAIARALNPPYDEKAWQQVDSEQVLASDLYDTKDARLTKRKAKPSAFDVRLDAAYGSTTVSADGQAPWVLTVGQRGGGSPSSASPSAGESAKRTAMSWIRTSAGWRLAATIAGVDPATLPPQGTPPAKLTAAQRQAAANVVPAVARAVNVGDASTVQNPGPLTEFRKVTSSDGGKGYIVTPTCRPWGSPVGTNPNTAITVGTPALRVVRAGTVTLGVLAFDCSLYTEATDGGQIQIPSGAAAVEGDDGKPKTTVVRRSSLTVLLSIPDSGKATVLSSDGDLIIPAGK